MAQKTDFKILAHLSNLAQITKSVMFLLFASHGHPGRPPPTSCPSRASGAGGRFCPTCRCPHPGRFHGAAASPARASAPGCAVACVSAPADPYFGQTAALPAPRTAMPWPRLLGLGPQPHTRRSTGSATASNLAAPEVRARGCCTRTTSGRGATATCHSTPVTF